MSMVLGLIMKNVSIFGFTLLYMPTLVPVTYEPFTYVLLYSVTLKE